MKVAKNLVLAFIVGGCLSVLSQVFLIMSQTVLGPGSPFIGLMTLACMGLFGAVTFIFGFYQKLEQWSGFGAMLNFSGLASAVAANIETAKLEGESTGAAVARGLKLVLLIIGSGASASIVIAIINRILLSL